MAALSDLSNALKGLITAFDASSKWSSFGTAPGEGMPGGNVIEGRPEVTTQMPGP